MMKRKPNNNVIVVVVVVVEEREEMFIIINAAIAVGVHDVILLNEKVTGRNKVPT